MFDPDLDEKWEVLWNLNTWALMVVQGTRWVSGNERFMETYGSVLLNNWPEQLNLSESKEALAWLSSKESTTRPYVCKSKVGPEGQNRWLRLRRLEGNFNSKGRVLIEVEDVTEEREGVERIRVEGLYFHALIERTVEGISVFDTEANIVYECPSNKRIHGYESWEMEGKNLFEFCHEGDLERVMPRFENLAKGPGIVETEVIRFKHKDGHWVYLEGTVINAMDDPRVVGLVNNFRDVTSKLESERELRRAKDAAEEARRLQQHFLTNLSHEFKTPLTLVRGPLTDWAEGRIGSEQIPDMLGRVFRNLDRLNGLITELIDLSLLDSGSFAMEVNQHDLVAFIDSEVDNFSEVAAGKEIKLSLDAPERCSVFFDSNKMGKVISNLISNALRYSPERGEVCLTIHLLNDGEDGLVRVEVSDEGPGMSEEVRRRVFDRFYQADISMSRDHEGMGIGLALAREMVEMHGGKIGVKSALGEGSTFWIMLPLGCSHFDPDDIDTGAVWEPRPHTVGGSTATAVPVGLVEQASHRPRLLLVEDNDDMRAYLRINLDPYYQVTEAIDGRNVLKVVEEVEPEIVISDVMMPHVDGLMLCRELKELPRWRSIPIVLLSAKGSVDHRVEGLRAGANDYLAKPFSVVELLERLRLLAPWGTDDLKAEEVWKNKLEDCIEEGLGQADFDVKVLSTRLGYSERQLLRRVIQTFGMKPSELILQRRLERAHQYLKTKRYETVAEVAHAVGMSSLYFSRRYRRKYKVDRIRNTLFEDED